MKNYKSKICWDCGVAFKPASSTQNRCLSCGTAWRQEYERQRWQTPEYKARKREYQRQHYQRPDVKDARREYNRQRHQTPEYKAWQREYRLTPEFKAKRRKYEKQQHQTHPDKGRTKNRNRRAKKRKNFCDHVIGCFDFGARHMPSVCMMCFTTFDITADHWHPLEAGGLDCRFNLQPLCRSCNAWKGRRLVFPRLTMF